MLELINKWKGRKSNDKYLNGLVKGIDQQKQDHQQADEIHNQVFEEMDCLECANCCKSIPPIVSNRDVKRIAKRLGISKQTFTEQYLLVDSDGDQVINSSPCPFLEADNKCQIYEDRPAACRAYPHSGENMFFKNWSHHKRNAKYCPALLEILQRLSDIK